MNNILIDLSARLSSTYNIYLTAGQKISLNDFENYKFFLYVQTGATPTQVSDSDRMLLMSAWATEEFTITTTGWYGITMAKTDMSDFDESVISIQTLADYVIIQ